MLVQLVFSLVLVYCLDTSCYVNGECAQTTGSVCAQLGYNMSHIPNYLGHRTIKDATRRLKQLQPLFHAQCSNDTFYFLCSLFFPTCTTLQKIIPPCQSLCLNVKNGCDAHMKRFNYNWPKQFDCAKFPKVGDGQPCIFHNSTSSSTVNPKWPTIKNNKRRSLKKRQKSCWTSNDQKDKQCCRQGNRAVKKLQECTLKMSKVRKMSSKKKHFLKQAKKLCSRNKSTRNCYHDCCQYKKKQKKNKRRTRTTRRRKQ